MSKILELREKRAKAWDAAKALDIGGLFFLLCFQSTLSYYTYRH